MKKIIVIKIGGSLIKQAEMLEPLIMALKKLINQGTKFIIVHGGGPQADELNQKLGIPIKKVNGKRITDSQTLLTVKMIYKGLLNTDLVALCEKNGIPSIGISGVDGKIAEVVKRPLINGVDFGFVGDIKKINNDLINILLKKNYLPIITCLAIDSNGQVFNINADTLATEIALKLKVNKLIFATNVAGISENKNNKYIKQLSIDKAEKMIKNGTATDGMIPKIENIKKAFMGGINKILIVGGLKEQSKWINTIKNDDYGTVIVPNYKFIK
ncbi:MAG: acetylglutamate kinase [Patescibacteria group bacterium]